MPYSSRPMLHIHLLGPFRSQLDDQPLRLPKRRDTARLWAFLLVHYGQARQRDEIAAALWPESPQARFNLRHNLHALKAYLPAADGAEPWLLLDGESLAWNPRADAWIDLQAFESALAAGPGSLADAASLEDAVGIYSGELLAGWDDSWLHSARERLLLQHLTALEHLVRLNIERGAGQHALAFAERLVTSDPMREASHRLLIQVLLDIGDHPVARQRAADLRQMLQDELAAEPDPDTLALFVVLEAGESGLALRSPSFTPAIGLPPVGDGLPHFPGPLLGQAARDLLRMSLPRGVLTTLIGPPGVGKSRLAADMAAAGARDWPGGCVWLDLTTIAPETPLAMALAANWALLDHGADDLAGWAEALASRIERPTLIVIDNADLYLADLALVARQLLSTVPQLSLLVTSRERVGISMERVCLVAPLAVPPEGAFGIADAAEALALLLTIDERLGNRRPPTRERVATLAGAARVADGLPEALLRIAHLAVGPRGDANLVAIGEGRLELLETSGRIDGLRHESLSASIGWTLDTLSPGAVLLFERLSIFAGRFAVSDAERCCQGDLGSGMSLPEAAILDGLQELAAASMLQVEGIDLPARHRLLGPLRWEAWRRSQARGEATELARLRSALFCRPAG